MDISLRFSNVKVCCVFSLNSPHRGDSNEYTQHTLSIKRKENVQNTIMSADMSYLGLKNKFEIAVINEPSVFEPLKFYCIYPQISAPNHFRPDEMPLFSIHRLTEQQYMLVRVAIAS